MLESVYIVSQLDLTEQVNNSIVVVQDKREFSGRKNYFERVGQAYKLHDITTSFAFYFSVTLDRMLHVTCVGLQKLNVSWICYVTVQNIAFYILTK